MSNFYTVQCGRCSPDDATQLIIKGDPISIGMCHCNMCRNRQCGLGGAFAEFNNRDVEIVKLNEKWTLGEGCNVMCECYDAVFFHPKDYKTDPTLKVNAGMISRANYGDNPAGLCPADSKPFFYGDFFKNNKLEHIQYEKRAFDWTEEQGQQEAAVKKPLPADVEQALADKVFPFACYCGKLKGFVSGDRMAATVCCCSMCRSRSSTLDASVQFPADAITYTTPEESELRLWGPAKITHCKHCGTVIDLMMEEMNMTMVNLPAILQELVGDTPADFDWGPGIENPRLKGPAELVADFHYIFYGNRAVNLYDESCKWVDYPGPFGGVGGLLDGDGNPLPLDVASSTA